MEKQKEPKKDENDEKKLWNKNRIIKIGLYDYDSIKKYGDLKSITTDIN